MAEVPTQTWATARDLVVRDGLSYADAAIRAGVGLSALQKRAARDGWQAARQEHVQARSSYQDNVRELKTRLLTAALQGDVDPQTVHAWRSVEQAFPEHRYSELSQAEKYAMATFAVEWIATYLGGCDPKALETFRPHIRPIGEGLSGADWKVAS